MKTFSKISPENEICGCDLSIVLSHSTMGELHPHISILGEIYGEVFMFGTVFPCFIRKALDHVSFGFLNLVSWTNCSLKMMGKAHCSGTTTGNLESLKSVS